MHCNVDSKGDEVDASIKIIGGDGMCLPVAALTALKPTITPREVATQIALMQNMLPTIWAGLTPEVKGCIAGAIPHSAVPRAITDYFNKTKKTSETLALDGVIT